MQIAIIGAGSVGSALAHGLSAKGHSILLGVRDASDPKLGPLLSNGLTRATSPQQAAAAADIVILALPWAAAETAVAGLGNLSGKVVIDCMNPLGMRDGALGLLLGFDTSGAEQLARWLPGARIVKTLNQVGAEVMADTSGFAVPPVMFMAGDDQEAKTIVAGLLTDLGFDPHDAGALRQARLLEPFGMVWINQAILRGKGRDWAFVAMPRQI